MIYTLTQNLKSMAYQNLCLTYEILNWFSILSAITLAIANEEVAPGDGAFLQCKIRLLRGPAPESNTKSSTRFPFESMAWALTPLGPLNLLQNFIIKWLENENFIPFNIRGIDVWNEFL